MYMVNLEKYKNDGWGLSKKSFDNLITLIKELSHNNSVINVVEFGSGMSTEFFVDMINDGYNLNVVSYDDNKYYSSKVQHDKLNLLISNLVECSDDDFELQFTNKQLNKNLFDLKTSSVHTRQKNTFYDVNDDDIPQQIDIMVVDGPHGNGRSLAFLHGINKLKNGSYVLIDDYNHYDFVEKFLSIFSDSELIYSSNTGNANQWELGGNYVIYKIK